MNTDLLEPNRAEEAVWGIAAAIDIYGCSPEKIRNADHIRNFVVELCELIEMKRFGDTQVVPFGEDVKVAGFSMEQLIETSLMPFQGLPISGILNQRPAYTRAAFELKV